MKDTRTPRRDDLDKIMRDIRSIVNDPLCRDAIERDSRRMGKDALERAEEEERYAGKI